MKRRQSELDRLKNVVDFQSLRIKLMQDQLDMMQEALEAAWYENHTLYLELHPEGWEDEEEG